VTSTPGKRYEVERFAERILIHKVPVNKLNIHHASNRELLTYSIRSFALTLKRHSSAPFDLCFAWSAVPAGAVALGIYAVAGLRYLVRVCGPDIPGFDMLSSIYPLLTPVMPDLPRLPSSPCEGGEPIRAVNRMSGYHCVEWSIVLTRRSALRQDLPFVAD
jgi:hypothetical protein